MGTRRALSPRGGISRSREHSARPGNCGGTAGAPQPGGAHAPAPRHRRDPGQPRATGPETRHAARRCAPAPARRERIAGADHRVVRRSRLRARPAGHHPRSVRGSRRNSRPLFLAGPGAGPGGIFRGRDRIAARIRPRCPDFAAQPERNRALVRRSRRPEREGAGLHRAGSSPGRARTGRGRSGGHRHHRGLARGGGGGFQRRLCRLRDWGVRYRRVHHCGSKTAAVLRPPDELAREQCADRDLFPDRGRDRAFPRDHGRGQGVVRRNRFARGHARPRLLLPRRRARRPRRRGNFWARPDPWSAPAAADREVRHPARAD